MTKGTYARGKHSKHKVHLHCRRCGEKAYHIRRNICASCGYGKNAKMRKYAWNSKRVGKKTTKR